MTGERLSAPVTRLAPTPSGRLHAGNAYSFVLAWLWARTRGGRIVLRVEDTDTTRSRPELVEGVFEDLRWLGLDWDEGPEGPGDRASAYFQSSASRRERYQAVLHDWIREGRAYPCRCTRKELALDAPQVANLADSAAPSPAYPGRCRTRTPDEARPTDSWRLALPSRQDRFEDALRGPAAIDDLAVLGDPVLRRADGCTAYHLAVCVDDADQGVNTVVRGRDLVAWSHLHRHLHELLGTAPPRFAHHGLAGGAEGERLAKRIGSWSLQAMRLAGIPPERLLGRFAPLLHPDGGFDGSPISLRELATLPPPSPSPDDFVLTPPETP